MAHPHIELADLTEKLEIAERHAGNLGLCKTSRNAYRARAANLRRELGLPPLAEYNGQPATTVGLLDLNIKPTPERIANRERIQNIWRFIHGFDKSRELVTNPKQWLLLETLLEIKD